MYSTLRTIVTSPARRRPAGLFIVVVLLLTLTQPASAGEGRQLGVPGVRGGVVTTSEPLAAKVGARILREGGNAVDAAATVAFAQEIQDLAESSGQEITPERIWRAFEETYLGLKAPFEFVEHRSRPAAHASELRDLDATIRENGTAREISGQGTGPIDAFVMALNKNCDITLRVIGFHEHALGAGADATAAAHVEIEDAKSQHYWGVGMHPNIVTASLRAVVSAANQVPTVRARVS